MGTVVKDEVGNRYGRLTVLRRYDTSSDPSPVGAYWLYHCDCGTEVAVLGSQLRNGNTRSCGCLRNMRKEERELLGFPTYGEIARERRKARKQEGKKAGPPPVKALYLQLDSLTGLRRALQEQVDKTDARIKELQTRIKEAEARTA